METIIEIKDGIKLDTADSIYAFMKKLRDYQLLVAEKEYNTGLESHFKEDSIFKLAKPWVQQGVARKDIKEFGWAIGLDNNLNALYIELLSIGDIHRTLTSAWLAYRGTAYYDATAIVIVHNHLNGNPAPADEDIAFTKDAIEGGLKLGSYLVDHIIMGADGYYSFEDDDKMATLRTEVVEDIKGRRALRNIITEKIFEIDEKTRENRAQAKRIAELEAQLKGH